MLKISCVKLILIKIQKTLTYLRAPTNASIHATLYVHGLFLLFISAIKVGTRVFSVFSADT